MKLQLIPAAQREIFLALLPFSGQTSGASGVQAHPLASIRVSWHAICVALLQCLVQSLCCMP